MRLKYNPLKSSSLRSFTRKAGRMFLTILATLAAALLILVAALYLSSPGKPAPLVDANGVPLPGSLSEKVFVTLNGVQQGMFIKSRDLNNPVLLYLHGGMPDYFLSAQYPTGLEDYFTVVWWEQRGSGLSYHPGIPPETMTTEQMVADTIAVTNYLRDRFGQDKIYLMGHSGGTFFGIQAAARAPELYHAYIGVAQMSYQLKSEQLASEYMLARFEAAGNTRMVRRLSAAPITMTTPLPPSYSSVRDVAMHSLGIGTTRDMDSVVTGILLPSFRSRDYTLGEKINLWRGKIFSGRCLWDAMLAADLTQQVTELQVPVYFFHGVHDYTVSYTLAASYFTRIKAPLKGFYTFEHSAHSPLFEEPEKMRLIFQQDIFAGTNAHADIK